MGTIAGMLSKQQTLQKGFAIIFNKCIIASVFVLTNISKLITYTILKCYSINRL